MRLAIRLSEHKSGQKSFDSESFDYFKSSEELEMVSMMKSVPNLISYLQKFSQIFSSPCSHFFCAEGQFRVFLKKGKMLTSGARLSAAKPPRAVQRTDWLLRAALSSRRAIKPPR
jgi:hypothetical protein